MNIFIIFSLISAFLSFGLGIIVYSKGSKNSLNRSFLLFCMSISILSFSEYGMRQAESYNTAKFWFILTGVFPLCAFLFFYFTLIFYNKDYLKNVCPCRPSPQKWGSPRCRYRMLSVPELTGAPATRVPLLRR